MPWQEIRPMDEKKEFIREYRRGRLSHRRDGLLPAGKTSDTATKVLRRVRFNLVPAIDPRTGEVGEPPAPEAYLKMRSGFRVIRK